MVETNMIFFRAPSFFFAVITLLFSNLAMGQTASQPYIERALELELQQHATWHKLLHFDSILMRSEVLTDSFFIAQSGRTDPKLELIATLEAYFASLETDRSTPIQCQFPARYLWLNRQLGLPEYEFRQPACDAFERWAKLDEVRSISAIMVSGYFGNPASTFGHSLLKFNSDEASRYLDLTFNYGALVPEGEPILRYIYKGILGGYESGFSDGYYYSQDMVYSRTEFRDMWDYELNLSEYERHLIISHLWEVAGKKFDYYFLTKNCAFRIAEVLALVEDNDDLTSRSRLWYAPVELFNRIEDVNQKKSGNYIQDVRFVPSYQRTLYARLANLSDAELTAFNRAIELSEFTLADLDQAAKMRVLNSLMAYYEFKDVGLMDEKNLIFKQLKRRVLLKRLALPVAPEDQIDIPSLPSPQQTSPPMMFSLGLRHIDQPNKAQSLSVNWSPFFYDTVSLNSLQGSELVVFDAKLRVNEDRAELEGVDLIRLRKMPAFNPVAAEKKEWAWTVQLGLKRNQSDELTPSVKTGLFDGFAIENAKYLYGANIRVQPNNESLVYAEPYLAWYYQQERFKVWFEVAQSYDLDAEDWTTRPYLKASYFLTPKHAIRLEASDEERSSLMLSYQYFR